ncbi:DNA-binding transcriptional regulator, GntR family [Seinonella peptonophila]|uniref:DNA-binding transcriptional regulator, GntR family n=1 Tax=Seinonella peptonophila TaxID=112248 RepID=A0A1M5BKV1_9BACL|nr:GntR family transcriptional regulator [Seinonella peptonophila]SHF42887.1 DNA-binding transcriptional regulator, GntR family [Seinonella peptonophila]
MLDKLRPQSIREMVFKKLRQDILRGIRKPGEKLIEGELANSLGVSRTPIREALHKLEQEGLIEVFPRKYSLVIGITNESLNEINLIRALLEPAAAKQAVDHLTDQQLQEMEELLNQSEYYFQTNDIKNLLRVHDAFHQMIITASKLPRIIQVLENMHDYIVRFRISFLSHPELVARSVREHRMIFEATKLRDAEKVEEIFKEHLFGISEYATVALEQNMNIMGELPDEGNDSLFE